jgi:hypothetical protein
LQARETALWEGIDREDLAASCRHAGKRGRWCSRPTSPRTCARRSRCGTPRSPRRDVRSQCHGQQHVHGVLGGCPLRRDVSRTEDDLGQVTPGKAARMPTSSPERNGSSAEVCRPHLRKSIHSGGRAKNVEMRPVFGSASPPRTLQLRLQVAGRRVTYSQLVCRSRFACLVTCMFGGIWGVSRFVTPVPTPRGMPERSAPGGDGWCGT